MKKTIRQLKRAVNFAKRSFGYDGWYDKEADDIGKSREELLTNKCRIINEQLFGKEQTRWKNPYDLIKFLSEVDADNKGDPDPKSEEIAEICEHLIKVINSLMTEPILSRVDTPESLAVHFPSSLLENALYHHLYGGKYVSKRELKMSDDLVTAIENEDVPRVNKLLKEGVNVNITSTNKIPLLSAVETGNTDIVNLILEAGVFNGNKISALSHTIHSKDVGMAEVIADYLSPQELTDAFISRVDTTRRAYGRYNADKGTDTDILQMLIDRGADINGYDRHGRTALGVALNPLSDDDTYTSFNVARFLLENGANPNIKIRGFRTEPTAFYFAICRAPYDIIKLMITKGADVNAKDDAGQTPLMSAVGANKKQVVRLLVANGADINAKSNKGGISYLLSRNPEGESILTLAKRKKDQSIAKYLLSLGAKE